MSTHSYYSNNYLTVHLSSHSPESWPSQDLYRGIIHNQKIHYTHPLPSTATHTSTSLKMATASFIKCFCQIGNSLNTSLATPRTSISQWKKHKAEWYHNALYCIRCCHQQNPEYFNETKDIDMALGYSTDPRLLWSHCISHFRFPAWSHSFWRIERSNLYQYILTLIYVLFTPQ